MPVVRDMRSRQARKSKRAARREQKPPRARWPSAPMRQQPRAAGDSQRTEDPPQFARERTVTTIKAQARRAPGGEYMLRYVIRVLIRRIRRGRAVPLRCVRNAYSATARQTIEVCRSTLRGARCCFCMLFRADVTVPTVVQTKRPARRFIHPPYGATEDERWRRVRNGMSPSMGRVETVAAVDVGR